MRGAAASMTVLRPATMREALAMYARTPDAVPLTGGTDLMVAWNLGEMNGRVILDLSGLRSWTHVVPTATSLRIGALVTHTDLQQHAIVRRRFPLLADACGTIG